MTYGGKMNCGGKAPRGGANPWDKPILTYFDATGLGEQTRICFLMGGVQFVDRRVSHEEWAKHYKAYSPTGRAPYVEVNGNVLTDSQAVLQYAARRGGLMPSNPEDAFKASMVIEMMESHLKEFQNEIPDDIPMEGRMKMIYEWATKDLPEWCEKYEAFFKSWMDEQKGEEYLIGNKLSYLDVYVAASIYRAQTLTKLRIIPDETKYPVLTKIYHNIMENPRVAAYVHEQKRKSSKVVFYHFGHPGYTDAIMWAMKLGKIEYEERVVSKDEWENGFKEQSPSGKLPMLEVDGEKYVESVAILQYVATRAGLVPENDFEAGHALAIVKLCSEVKESVIKVKKCKDPEAKNMMIEKMVAVQMPEMIARLEEVVGQRQDHEGHVVGKTLSYADLWVAATFGLLRRAGHHCLKITNLENVAPKMFKTFHMVHGIPAIAQYKSEKMTAVKPVLTYFNASGRGEAIRYALHIGGIDFEDRRVSFEEWGQIYKAMSPTGQCPFLTVGKGQTIVETKAIVQWVMEVAPQLKPSGRLERVKAEQLVSATNNMDMAAKAYFEAPMAERDAQVPKIRDEIAPPILVLVERLFADASTHKGYSVGDKHTYVDCWIAGKLQMANDFKLLQDNWKETYPTLAAIYDAVISHPKVAAYRAAAYH